MERNRSSLKNIILRIILAVVVVGTLLYLAIIPTQANDIINNSTLPTIFETIVFGATEEAPSIEPTEETIDLDAIIDAVLLPIQYNLYATSEEVSLAIEEINTYRENLVSTIEIYADTEIVLMAEIKRIEEIRLQYELNYTNLKAEEDKWAQREAEYPEATFIWRYMREEFQWSPEVCAGIIGNMMSECGGQTLKGLSNWNTDDDSGYGLIQWIGGRRKAIEAKYGSHPSIEEQLIFMKDEMYGTNGVTNQLYVDGWLEAIMDSETPEQAAARFACYFERPASTYYGVRQRNARVAYDYFVD